MTRIGNTCTIEIDENNYLKKRTVCKSCYTRNGRKNINKTLNQNQQPKIYKYDNNNDNNPDVSTYENHRQVVIGPSNVCKTYCMLRVLEKIRNKRAVHILNQSKNQYPIYTTTSEFKPTKKNKGSVVTLDDMLGARNSSQIDEYFRRGRDENLDVYYNSQSYFGLPRLSIRNNNDRLKLFKQTFRDIQSMYYDFGVHDMRYDEFKGMCHKTWSERLNYLCIDIAKIKNEGKYRIFNESKNIYIECIPEGEPL